ncbi:hypothetical protein FVER53590_28343 [Fusarium verticillioides]|nr:hypothetical protein FVER53590_28343 [Fusarium verticillioides]
MAPTIPFITITAPDGSQEPVQIFPFPAARDELVSVSEFFSGQVSAPVPEHSSASTPGFDAGISQEALFKALDVYWRRFPEYSDKNSYGYSFMFPAGNGSFLWTMNPWMIPNIHSTALSTNHSN